MHLCSIQAPRNELGAWLSVCQYNIVHIPLGRVVPATASNNAYKAPDGGSVTPETRIAALRPLLTKLA